MKDRISTHPGRVKMTPVSGEADTYDMQLADSPIEAGTPLNKATFLTDATASKLGFASTDDPTVDDAFNAVPKLSQIRQTLPVAEGVTIQTGDVVDVVDGQVTKSYKTERSIIDVTPVVNNSFDYDYTIFIDNDNFVTAYVNNNRLYLIHGKIENNSTTIDASIEVGSCTYVFGSCKLGDTKVLYGYYDGSSYFYCIYELVNGQLTLRTNDGISFQGYSSFSTLKIVKMSESQIIIVCSRNQESIYVYKFSLSNNTLTYVDFNSVHSYSNLSLYSACKLSETEILISYKNGSSSYYCDIITFGDSITWSKRFLQVSNMMLNHLNYLEDGKVIAVGRNNNLYAYILNVTSEGMTVDSSYTSSYPINAVNGVQSTSQTVLISSANSNSDSNNGLYATTLSILNGSLVEQSVVKIEKYANPGPLALYAYMRNDYPAYMIEDYSGSNYKLTFYNDYAVPITTQAFALTSGTAGQDVDIAYDGVFDFDGLEIGQSVYDGNNALIAYCPVAGRVNVIGYWKRDDKAFVTGSYVGTGGTGSNNRNSLSWDKCPQLVIVAGSSGINAAQQIGIFVKDVPNMAANCEYSNAVIWNDTGFEWYLYSGSNTGEQLNYPSMVYHYIAFFE